MSIKKIQKLRNITALGMMECKEALLNANGDIEKAIETLYSKGTIKYVKKNAEKLGFVNVSLSKNRDNAIIIELNTQTDFVSKNQQFLDFVKEVTKVALDNKIEDINNLLKQSIGDKNIEQYQSILVNKFKENIHISKLKFISTSKGILGGYVHNNKIATVVTIDKKEKEIAHDIAIHVAAMKPEYINIKDIENARIEKEKSFLTEQVKQQHPNKNANILEKITEGKMNKLFQDIVLMKQVFVKDKNKSIESLLREKGCKVNNIFRFEVSKN